MATTRLVKRVRIAIDGPVASGKSTCAYLLAKKLDILYFYTGALYRAVAWLGIKHKIDLNDENKLAELVKKSKIELKKPSKKNRFCDVFVNNKNITDRLFTPKIHWGSSQVAVHPKIRQLLVPIQINVAKKQSVVMEGRDITTVVLPKADLKIYMTAENKTRAKRRLKQLKKTGHRLSFKTVLKDINKRDKKDMERQLSPLTIAPDAWTINTSQMTIKQEVNKIIDRLAEKGLVIKK